jgi:DNA-binding beta-propeller fold protein YncE
VIRGINSVFDSNAPEALRAFLRDTLDMVLMRSMHVATAALLLAGRTAHAQGGAAVEECRTRSGDLVAANLVSSTVSLFEGRTGRFRCLLVAAGSGGLANATGLAFSASGDLFVSSSKTDAILRFAGSSGEFLGAFVQDSALRAPFSLAFGPTGDLFVSSGQGHVVRRYDGTTGAFLGVAASDSALRQPIGLAFGPDTMLYVVNSGGRSIFRFDPATGRGVPFAVDSLRYPADLAFGPDGALYVSDAASARVVRFDGRTGAWRGVVGVLPTGAAPVGLAFDAEGTLFVADYGRSRLFRLRPADTAFELVASEGMRGPENIAVYRR